MVNDPYRPEPPFEYECAECGDRFEAGELPDYDATDELVDCPACGGTLWNLTTPNHE